MARHYWRSKTKTAAKVKPVKVKPIKVRPPTKSELAVAFVGTLKNQFPISRQEIYERSGKVLPNTAFGTITRALHAAGYEYALEGATVTGSHAVWYHPESLSPSELGAARTLLLTQLNDGPRPARRLREYAFAQAISWRAIVMVKAELGITSTILGLDDDAPYSVWNLPLPDPSMHTAMETAIASPGCGNM